MLNPVTRTMAEETAVATRYLCTSPCDGVEADSGLREVPIFCLVSRSSITRLKGAKVAPTDFGATAPYRPRVGPTDLRALTLSLPCKGLNDRSFPHGSQVGGLFSLQPGVAGPHPALYHG